MIPILVLLSNMDSEEDQNKLQTIYEKYLGVMTAVAQKYVRSSDVEDVVSISVIKMTDYLDRINLDDELSTYGYIRRIVKSCAIDWLRNPDNATEDIDELSSTLEDDELPVIDRVIAKDGYEFLVRCIRSLNDTYRDVCELRLVYDMSYKQISKELDITVKNVSVRYSRGLKLIKSMLRDGGYYEEYNDH